MWVSSCGHVRVGDPEAKLLPVLCAQHEVTVGQTACCFLAACPQGRWERWFSHVFSLVILRCFGPRVIPSELVLEAWFGVRGDFSVSRWPEGKSPAPSDASREGPGRRQGGPHCPGWPTGCWLLTHAACPQDTSVSSVILPCRVGVCGGSGSGSTPTPAKGAGG